MHAMIPALPGDGSSNRFAHRKYADILLPGCYAYTSSRSLPTLPSSC